MMRSKGGIRSGLNILSPYISAYIMLLMILLIAGSGLAQQQIRAYGHGGSIIVTADTTNIDKTNQYLYYYSTDGNWYVSGGGILKQVTLSSTATGTITATVAQFDTIEGLNSDSVFVNDDMVFLQNILFKAVNSNKSYWVDADGDTVIVIDPNYTSGAAFFLMDSSAADTIYFLHDGTDFKIVEDGGTGAVELNANNGNAARKLLSIVNTDEQATTETNQTADLYFYVQGTSDGGSSYADAATARISGGKSGDYFNASGTADNDGLYKVQVSNGGTLQDRFLANYFYSALAVASDVIYWDGTAIYSTDDSYDLGKSGNRFQNAFISDGTQIGVCYAAAPALLTINENADTLVQFYGDKDGSLWGSADSAGLMQLQNGDIEIGNSNTAADLALFGGQISGEVEHDNWAFHFDQTTTNPDTVWLGLWNDFGVTVTVDSTKITSDTDDQDFEYYYRPFGGGGTTIIDQLTGSTNYVGYYGITDASPTQASIPSNAQIGFLKPTVADDNIGVCIHFHYTKQKR